MTLHVVIMAKSFREFTRFVAYFPLPKAMDWMSLRILKHFRTICMKILGKEFILTDT